MKFEENEFFKKLPTREQNLVRSMWLAGSGYPIPYDRDYLSVVCYAEGLDVDKTLPKNWFFKTIYNLRVTGIIDLFTSPKKEPRLYFVERTEAMKENKSGPFEEGAWHMDTRQWNRVVQTDPEKVGKANRDPDGRERADTRESTKNETIPKKKYPRNKWRWDSA